MPRYEAIFVKVQGLATTVIGGGHGLKAESLDEAGDAALAIRPRPEGANFVHVLDEGRVVQRLGFAL